MFLSKTRHCLGKLCRISSRRHFVDTIRMELINANILNAIQNQNRSPFPRELEPLPSGDFLLLSDSLVLVTKFC